MKEIAEILKVVDGFADEERAVLATVVDLKGSGYRLPGARMLIKANGDAVGTVSGGCLEADVMERAKRVLETGRAEVFVYDTTADENSVFSLNMGCRGVLRILLEPISRESEIIEVIRDAYEQRRSLTVATLIDSGTTAHVVGSRVIVDDLDPSDDRDQNYLSKDFANLHDDLATFSGSVSNYETIHYEAEDGTVEFVFESIRPPVQIVILGAGADAVPLADAAHGLGWRVKVYDHRPAFLSRERFGSAGELMKTDRDAAPPIDTDELTAIVLMNHNYDRDKLTLPAALRSNAFYVGALGPKKRTAQMMDELAAAGETFDQYDLAHLRSPAGLDIGGDTPEAIAISIIAEIQSVLKNRPGGPLRDRNAPIYDRK